MTALANTDVTYTIISNKKLEDGRRIVMASLVFGDGAKTYPTNGVPLINGNLACPVHVHSVSIDDTGASLYIPSWDKTHATIRMLQSAAGSAHVHSVPSHTHDLFFNNLDVVDGATTRVNVGANLMGANTGTDITVAGVQNNAAGGGIIAVAAGTSGSNNSAAGTLVELTTAAAPAAQTYKVTVIGW